MVPIHKNQTVCAIEYFRYESVNQMVDASNEWVCWREGVDGWVIE
jgi:hypothetical protein